MSKKSVKTVEKKTDLREYVVTRLLEKTAGAMTITRPQLLEVLAETAAGTGCRFVKWPYWFTDVAEYRPKRGVYLLPKWTVEMDEYKAYHSELFDVVESESEKNFAETLAELQEFADQANATGEVVETARQKLDEVEVLVESGVDSETIRQYADISTEHN